MRRIAEFLERYDSADLAGLSPETREELRRMARYAYERYGWKTIVHEGKASSYSGTNRYGVGSNENFLNPPKDVID